MGKGFLVFILLAQAACASTAIIKDRAYEDSLNAYRRSDFPRALAQFPAGESGGFITSLEKSWISVWTDQWDPKALQKQADTFEQRKYVSLSREAGTFLFQESEEGYVPSEHEVVILHLVSAIHDLKSNRSEDARVELRQAGYVLDRFWDDPALRLWLGTLWLAAGSWEEAQVDFRRANELEPRSELKALLNHPPPQNLTLTFSGVAPEVHWRDGWYTPEFLRSPEEPEVQPHASTLRWFKRHAERNTDLRDMMVKSNFMAQYLGAKVGTAGERGMNKTATWSLRAIIVAATAAVIGVTIYALGQSGSQNFGEGAYALLGAELGAGVAGVSNASRWDRELESEVKARERAKNEDLRIYRMMRFLPGWIRLEAAPLPTASLDQTVSFSAHGSQVNLVNHP